MRVTPVERDGELRINAALPDTAIAREVAEDVRSGRRAGLSVEFYSLHARFADYGGGDCAIRRVFKVRAKGNHRRVLTWL